MSVFIIGHKYGAHYSIEQFW